MFLWLRIHYFQERRKMPSNIIPSLQNNVSATLDNLQNTVKEDTENKRC